MADPDAPRDPAPQIAEVPVDSPADRRVLLPRIWSLERDAASERYLIAFRGASGERWTVSLSAFDLLGMAAAVLDDEERADATPRLQ